MWVSEFTSNYAALQGGMVVLLRPLFAAALVVRCRYFIVAPRPCPAAPLIGRRRCLIVVLRRLFAAALVLRRRYFIVAPRPCPAAPLVVRRRC